tara:strand:+ start:463 stop:1392 length:930 start_codon:yes stop_codon:yes gene_type:complete
MIKKFSKFIWKNIYIPLFIIKPFIYFFELIIFVFKYTGEYDLKFFETSKDFKKLSRETVQKINSKDSVLLLTLRKSGSNYLMNLISTYFLGEINDNLIINNKKVFNFRNGIIWYGENLNTEFRFNENENSYFFFQHIEAVKKNGIFFNGKIIFLIRNPRDWIISLHNYLISRKDIYYKPKKVSHSIDYLMPIFCKSMKEVEYLIRDKNDICINYEDLVSSPKSTIKLILEFLELKVDDKKIDNSIETNSIQNYKKLEKNNYIDHGYQLERGSFIRNPEIGQWKQKLNKNDIKKIDQYIKKYKIMLNFKY